MSQHLTLATMLQVAGDYEKYIDKNQIPLVQPLTTENCHHVMRITEGNDVYKPVYRLARRYTILSKKLKGKVKSV